MRVAWRSAPWKVGRFSNFILHVATTGFAFGFLLSACQPPSPAPLVPTLRLLDLPLETSPHAALETRPFVRIDGLMHPTIDASRPLGTQSTCKIAEQNPELVDCRMGLPAMLNDLEWIAAEAPLFTGERKRLAATQSQDPTPPKLRRKRVAFRHEDFTRGEARLQLPKASERHLRLHGMPPLASRSARTPPLALRPGSQLQVRFGVEETAWITPTAPVVFSVVALRDGQTSSEELFRQTLDPSRVPEDRGWHSVRIPLPISNGAEKIRLSFETAPDEGSQGLSSLPVWGDPTIFEPTTDGLKPKRIVLISLDTLRARSMSAYGYPVETTPFFSELAGTGVLFEKAFTTFSNTLGSHMSMLTGLYPGTHLVFESRDQLDTSQRTLAEHLRNGGYETAAFTENALLRAEQFRRGFGTYFEEKEVRQGAGTAERTFDRALAWAKKQESRPFFLFVHTYEVHAPYRPREGSAASPGTLPSSPAAAAEMRLDYEQEIVSLDHLLKNLVSGLDALGDPEDLLVIITADHGEEFLEHGSLFHLQLYDEVMHIPLLMRWPTRIPAGVRSEVPVSLIDVVPTVLSLAGLPTGDVDGVSLLPLAQEPALSRTTVFGQVHDGAKNGPYRKIVGRTAQEKCLIGERDDRVQCYDLSADPNEKQPLAADASPKLKALHDQVVGYRQSYREHQAKAAAAKRAKLPEGFDPVRAHKLRALGYVD